MWKIEKSVEFKQIVDFSVKCGDLSKVKTLWIFKKKLWKIKKSVDFLNTPKNY